MRTDRILLALVTAVSLIAGARTPADADPPPWHAGVEARAELGLHPVRVTGGVVLGRVDVTAVVDPLAAIDGQHDLDLIAGWAIRSTGWRLGGGLRVTTIAVAGGLHWQERLLAGATSRLARLGRHLRATVGFEASALIVKHGGGAATDWLSLSVGRKAWEAFDLGIFLRFEYAQD